mgnify:CR=1 FL=1
MPRYIDADELLKQYPFNKDTSRRTDDFEDGINTAIDSAVMAIEDAPTVEDVHVRHGHWKIKKDGHISVTVWSYCYRGYLRLPPETYFCPNCGAKMDEVVKE